MERETTTAGLPPRGTEITTWPEDSFATDGPAVVPWPSALDRLIPLGLGSAWQTAGWVICLVVALGLRFSRLDRLGARRRRGDPRL